MTKHTLTACVVIAILASIFTVSLISDGLSSRGGYHCNNRVTVLEYHHIAPEVSDYTITPESFEKDLEILQANHYHIIPVEQFIRFMMAGIRCRWTRLSLLLITDMNRSTNTLIRY